MEILLHSMEGDLADLMEDWLKAKGFEVARTSSGRRPAGTRTVLVLDLGRPPGEDQMGRLEEARSLLGGLGVRYMLLTTNPSLVVPWDCTVLPAPFDLSQLEETIKELGEREAKP